MKEQVTSFQLTYLQQNLIETIPHLILLASVHSGWNRLEAQPTVGRKERKMEWNHETYPISPPHYGSVAQGTKSRDIL